MTNLEWLLKNNKADFISAICASHCWGVKNNGTFYSICDGFNCIECKFGDPNEPCSVKKAYWLEAEYEEPLLFPIGTIVEVSDSDNTKHTGYYNGFENGKHYVSHYRHFLGCRYHDGELYGGKYDANQIRKVGEVND